MKKIFKLVASIFFTFTLIGCSNFNLMGSKTSGCTVTFETEYGKTPKALHVNKGDVLTDSQLKDLKYEPMIFVGWFLGDKQIRSYEYKITKDITLTAKWDYPFTTFEVSFDSDYGTVPSSFYIKENEILTQAMLHTLVDPADINNKFLGWYDGKTLVKAGEYKVTKDICLEAKWDKSPVPPSTPNITGMWKLSDDSLRFGFLSDSTAYMVTLIPDLKISYFMRGTYTITDTQLTLNITHDSLDFIDWEELPETEKLNLQAAYTLSDKTLSIIPDGETPEIYTNYSSNIEDLKY